MSMNTERCQVCGRTPQELEDIFGRESPMLIEVEGIIKCDKCDDEYKAGLEGEDDSVDVPVRRTRLSEISI